MINKKSYPFVLLGIAAALGITILVRRRREDIGSMPRWRPVLLTHYGKEKTEALEAAIREQNNLLLATEPMPGNPSLRWHLRENIIPGLALYKVLLQEKDGNQQAALAEVNEAFRRSALIKNRLLLAPTRLVPEPFRVLRLVFPQMMKKFPSEGWDFTFVENSDHRIAFNATRCYYLNTLTALGAPELTASFCQTDDVMAELFPPSIRFVRPHTLGRGDTVCDFQYCHYGNRVTVSDSFVG